METIQHSEFPIFVRNYEGKSTQFNVTSNTCIADIKNMIYSNSGKNGTGVPVDQQRLVFAGKELDNNLTINDYNIAKDNTVNLIMRLVGGY